MGARAEIGVVGAGITGLATALALKDLGASVRVYERGVPGGDQSAGEARIFRHAHDDPRLIEFARRSRGAWSEWEERFGVELVSRDGAVAIGSAVEDRLELLRRAGDLPARSIDPSELGELLPQLASYDGPAMVDEAGGAIRTRTAVRELSGELEGDFARAEVISLRPTAEGPVEVRTGEDVAEHAAVIVCAGRSTARLARGLGLSLPVRLSAHSRVTFEVRERSQGIACLQDSSGDFGETGTYAAPQPGNDRYAVGLAEMVGVSEHGNAVDPDGLASLAERAAAYVRRALPGLDPEPVEVLHCWVTELPWGEDGMAVWEDRNVLFLAGHNLFKQAPELGRALARAALGDGLEPDLHPAAELGRDG